jgi:hypothetical protein
MAHQAKRGAPTEPRPTAFEAPWGRVSPELALILHSSRSRPSAEDTAAVASIVGAGVDWGRLRDLVEHHRVTALVHRQLAALPPGAVPEDVAHDLRATYEAGVGRNMALAAELIRVLARLAGAGVRALPLKGPSLSVRLHGHVGLRHSADLDVYVRHEALPAAREALAQDYEPERGHIAALAHHVPMHHRHAPICLELHYAVTVPPRVLPCASTTASSAGVRATSWATRWRA